jgi:shikimate kinase
VENPPVPKNIILIGFMGSGKSSVGRVIAPQLGFALADTDQLVIQHTGLQITEIFKNHGETYFRDQETAVLNGLRDQASLVISTGGGIVLREGNAALLRELGFVAWLTASEETIYERVSRSNKRPLMHTADPRGTIRTLLLEREPLYASTAHFSIHTSGRTHEEVANAIILEARRTV